MHVEALESEIELDIEILEIDDALTAGYPLPGLRRTGSRTKRTFPCLVLENALARITFVPGLGGRILKWFDKVTGLELLLEGERLEFTNGGPRGVELPEGIEFSPFATSLGSAIGPVKAAIQIEGESGAICLGETVPGSGLSYHQFARLAEDEPALTLECRLANRTLRPITINPTYRLAGAPLAGTDGSLIAKGAFLVEPGQARFETVTNEAFSRHLTDEELAPRCTISSSITLRPVVGVGTPMKLSREVVVGIDGDTFVVRSYRGIPSSKLILQSASGKPLEAVADLQPDNPLRYPFDELGGCPLGVVILDQERRELLRWDAELSPPTQLGAFARSPEAIALPRWPISLEAATAQDLSAAQEHPMTRHAVAAIRTRQAFVNHEYELAEQRAEQQLTYNADDPLAWIEKAIAQRLRGIESTDEAPELANAHFLAPFEPLLRAESFFRMPSTSGAETLLTTISSMPDELVEVACFLLERRLLQDAVHLLESAIKLNPSPMLHYLVAFAYLQRPELRFEAAQAVANGSSMGQQPPYPSRRMETEALTELQREFTADAGLSHYLRLAVSFTETELEPKS